MASFTDILKKKATGGGGGGGGGDGLNRRGLWHSYARHGGSKGRGQWDGGGQWDRGGGRCQG